MEPYLQSYMRLCRSNKSMFWSNAHLLRDLHFWGHGISHVLHCKGCDGRWFITSTSHVNFFPARIFRLFLPDDIFGRSGPGEGNSFNHPRSWHKMKSNFRRLKMLLKLFDAFSCHHLHVNRRWPLKNELVRKSTLSSSFQIYCVVVRVSHVIPRFYAGGYFKFNQKLIPRVRLAPQSRSNFICLLTYRWSELRWPTS